MFWALTVSNNSYKEETLKYLCLLPAGAAGRPRIGGAGFSSLVQTFNSVSCGQHRGIRHHSGGGRAATAGDSAQHHHANFFGDNFGTSSIRVQSCRRRSKRQRVAVATRHGPATWRARSSIPSLLQRIVDLFHPTY